MRPIISSKKHYIQKTVTNISQGAVDVTNVCQAIEGASASPEHVIEGAVVKAVFVEMWVQDNANAAIGSFTSIFVKNPGGVNVPSATDMAALHDWDNKKNILYTTQGLAPQTDSGVLNMFKGWIKIPKGKQRMGLGDKLQWFTRNNNATAVDINICGMFTYKSYT